MQSGIGRRRESDIAQEKQNLHAGHRQRLKKRFDAVGLKGFEEHTLLELLLFYAIPQKDTNALAHELIRRFGSLDRSFWHIIIPAGWTAPPGRTWP